MPNAMVKTYCGIITADGPDILITADGGKTYRRLDPRYDLRNHSPDGFSWGYGGSGPAQTALALLADTFGAQVAQVLYQMFKANVIATLDMDTPWEMTAEEVRAKANRLR